MQCASWNTYEKTWWRIYTYIWLSLLWIHSTAHNNLASIWQRTLVSQDTQFTFNLLDLCSGSWLDYPSNNPYILSINLLILYYWFLIFLVNPSTIFARFACCFFLDKVSITIPCIIIWILESSMNSHVSLSSKVPNHMINLEKTYLWNHNIY